MRIETDYQLHKYLNMVSDLQMENAALRKQMEKDTLRFMEEQKRADEAEAKLKSIPIGMEKVEGEKLG
jgi:hypothetical protein